MPPASIEEITAAVAGQTAPRRFLEIVHAHPTAPALRSMRGREPGAWEMWTYQGYADRVAEAAAGLRATGLQAGERVVLMMRNRPDFHWLDLAAQFLRLTPVSIYNSSSAEEVEFLVDHAEARVAIVEDEVFLRRLLQARPHLPRLERIFVLDPPSGLLAPGVLAAAELFTHGRLDLDALAAEVEPEDLATLIYTSGTTGPPKGVMISQANVVYTVEQLRRCLAIPDLFGMRVVSYLPMAHIAERMTSHYQAMVLGFDVYCCPDAGLLSQYLREVHPQVLFGVPRVWEKLRTGVMTALSATPERLHMFQQAVDQALMVRQAQRAGTATEHQLALWRQLDSMAFASVRALLGLDAVRVAISGAAPIARDLLEWFDAIGVPISEIYGMSETSGPLTWSPQRNQPGSVGQAIPGADVTIAADGEICCRGGNVFQGYFKRPDLTAETIVDGWLHTGDIGELDPEGYLRIVDRKKELIITSGGKNISPGNLEAALTTIPLVAHAAAIGDNHKYVTALLTLDPEAATAWAAQHGREGATLGQLARDPDLIHEVAMGVARVNRQFARVERIKTFTILGEEWVPGSDVLTPTSKVKRRGVLSRYASDIEAMYADEDQVAVEPPPPPPPVDAAPAPAPPEAAPPAPEPGPADESRPALFDGGDDLDVDDGLHDDTHADTDTDDDISQETWLDDAERVQGAGPAAPGGEEAEFVDDEPTGPIDMGTTTSALAEYLEQRRAEELSEADFAEAPELEESRVVWETGGPERRGWRRWWWVALVVLAAAGLAAGLVATRHDRSGSSTATVPTTVAATEVPTTVAPTAATTTATTSTTTTVAVTTTAPTRDDLLFAIGQDEHLTTFVKAVEAAGLESELQADGPTTLFAPTDDAFAKLPPDQLEALMANKALLTQVLRHHLVDGSIRVQDLVDGPLTARDGTTIEVTAVEDLTLDGQARLVDTDHATVNGILHTIDTVLVPADVDLSTLSPGGGTTTAVPTTTSTTTGAGADFTVYFDPGSGLLNSAAKAIVKTAAQAIKALPAGSVVTVTGVTDDLGTKAENDYLANLRANSVVTALKAAGATKVTYKIEHLQEPHSTTDPQHSRRAEIDLP